MFRIVGVICLAIWIFNAFVFVRDNFQMPPIIGGAAIIICWLFFLWVIIEG